MHPLDRKLLRELLRLRGQAIAIGLVVACGIACFVMFFSALESLELTQVTYYDRYRFADAFAELKRAPESLATQIQAIPGVAQVQTRVVRDVTLDVPGLEEPATGRLVSIPERHAPVLNDVFLRQGRYIEPNRSDEVLVSEAFAEANHLQLEDQIGAIINGRWEELHIVGIALSPEYVYEVRGAGTIFPENKLFGVLWLGREALGNAFDMDGAFNSVALTLSRGASLDETIDRLDGLLDRYGGVGAYGRKDQLSHNIVANELEELGNTGTVMPTIFLAIAAFLINIVMTRLVATQREQIAVLKAFGYSNLDVSWHYLKLVLALVLAGTALGLGVGLWLGQGLTELYTTFFSFPLLRYTASSSTIVSAVLVSTGAAVLGGILAVRRAVVLPPAEAMRPEPPAEFRATLVERLGLQRFFNPPTRIILRNLERTPVRSLLSTVGIGVAVAILIASGFFQAALDRLIEVQFYNVQRDDVAIAFTEARPARVRHELDRLPGVLRAEPYRLVPARLRYGHRVRRNAITGIDPAGELRNLVDRDLNSVYLPNEGLVLTTTLAELLDVEVGDALTVEVLEGSRPVKSVIVAGTIDEMLGLSAYMNIAALNRLMEEDQTVSGAYLATDPQLSSQLYDRLKEIPAVTGISFREAALQSFEDISANNLRVTSGFLTVFACIISFSVIYNSARIALSERERELASLRIMGFTRAEIAYILLGEQAVLVLVAIPVGFAIGWGLVLLMSAAFHTELMRLPTIVTRSGYAFAAIVILLSALASGWIVRRRLDRLDLIAVLKTRE
ncbi:ABC transporter permease [Synechococcus sp. PCC 7336]|uniref:ABC transporter permease n=1 Tax=Synechococcus sp. PCC 7336 TaxID=195250 RepID=UPI00034700EA|nr:ABC transporter permease [Synechococcus sp. PCC 7336]